MRQEQDSPNAEGLTPEFFAYDCGGKAAKEQRRLSHHRIRRVTGRLAIASRLGLTIVVVGCGGTLDAGRNVPREAGIDELHDARDAANDELRDARDAEALDVGQDVVYDARANDSGRPSDSGAANDALDADSSVPRGLLPIDERNPVIIDNDGWSDNWHGEYAMLLANAGGPALEGIVVGASNYWPDLKANVSGWTDMVKAARSSGLRHIPDVTEGASQALTQPNDGTINSTVPIGSAGAHLIVDLSRKLSLPSRPVVILAGSQLTNIADAYLLDHSVVDRVVVLATLGQYKNNKALMSGPNGDLDPWADWIVAQKFQYMQICIDYDQAGDVTTEDLTRLPHNAFGDWMAAKQPNLSTLGTASDQVTVLAAALPRFVVAVQRSAPDTSAGFNSPPGQGPPLVPSSSGKAWVITEVEASLAPVRLWQLLSDSHTFGS